MHHREPGFLTTCVSIRYIFLTELLICNSDLDIVQIAADLIPSSLDFVTIRGSIRIILNLIQ